MLVPFGKRPTSVDVVDLLHECHGRIRRFLVMARELGSAMGASSTEVAETAAQIRRYFAESFPLHMEDEEIDIAPRVAHEVETSRLHAEHRAHASAVAELVVLCGLLEGEPRQHPAVAARLHAVALRLASDLETHLEFEERTMFPALRKLSQADRDAIRDAMRQRRSATLGVEE